LITSNIGIYLKKSISSTTFFGIAIPFGNSDNIPFSRSYFSGGSNDNRAWQPYSLGPGSSGALNDFNEANMAFSTEFRFKLLGDLKGALLLCAQETFGT
jgi:outer membrane protein assembly factor BamA